MSHARLALGAWGEDQAVEYLRLQGMKILERNYRTPVGEIDIIARNKKILLFVEVKTRRSVAFGSPQEAVGIRKQRQIIRTGQWYLQEHKCAKLQPRFDVVAVLSGINGTAEITHLTDAFSLPD
ncbi:YraN family protein [uncultured Desulfuromusa sp.]|uniref:YraN family protein n=1 Tax=uncultured Desulfuromusa sp. TaxID=219183 RepID=UPI002AA6504A|nr:YraN family protein [uncultured Desulfuromusa sp.]